MDKPNHSGDTWFRRVPKAELHVHIEGAIPPATLLSLIEKYEPGTIRDLSALRERLVYRDFPHFLETWSWKNRFLRSHEDFRFVAEAVARGFAEQNIRYVEAFFSPADFVDHGLETGRIAEAIRAGLSLVPEVEVALVADLVRDRGPKRAERTLREVHEARGFGILGIGIGGSEHSFPPEPFAAVFEEARRLGFRTSAHAGEAAGPASVWGAVRALRVDRIGHGTRAAEDSALLDFLARSSIPVEACPLSNVRSGVVPSLRAHPLRLFHERGILVTVNTDDPAMFGNSLAEELALLEADLGFSRAETRALLLAAVESSWLPAARKIALASAFSSDPAWASGPIG